MNQVVAARGVEAEKADVSLRAAAAIQKQTRTGLVLRGHVGVPGHHHVTGAGGRRIESPPVNQVFDFRPNALTFETSEVRIGKVEAESPQPPSCPNAHFGDGLSGVADPVALMTVAEQDPHTVRRHRKLLGHTVDLGRDQVVIAMDVGVLGAPEAGADLAVPLLSAPQFFHLPAKARRGQRFPDVSE